MKFLEKLQLIERVDALIKRKATGSAKELASRLNLSRRCVYDIINIMKSMSAPIEYCKQRSTYYYEYPCDLMIGFVNKNQIRGGISNIFEKNIWSANFLHN